MGKILTFLISPDKSLTIKKCKFAENRLIIKKGENEILFKPEHIFLKKRKLLPPQTCLIVQEGKLEPEKLGNPTFFIPMSNEEIRQLIKREIAKARMKVKPITLNLFIVLALIGIVQVILTIMVMAGVRIG